VKLSSAVASLALAGSMPGLALAAERARFDILDPAPGPCPVYQSADVQRHIDKAFELAGTDLPQGLIPSLFILPRAVGACAPARVPQFKQDTSVAQPVQAFDHLYYVGDKFVGAWALATDAGIILFDAMNNDEDVQSIVEPGLRQLGLNPADVKYIVVTHGHADHWGGAEYFQRNYGTKVLVGQGDIALLTRPQVHATHAPKVPVVNQPVSDGMRLSLGKTTVTLYISPGHTPGTVSAIFPVTDRGKPHVAGLFGGYGLPMQLEPDTKKPPSHMGLRMYMASVERFTQLGKAAGVDVGISTHPIFDDTISKGALMSRDRPGTSPWVMGASPWVRYMDAGLEAAKTFEAMLIEHPITRSLQLPAHAEH
jgi:metallo-beta-lactamase class B